MVSGGFLTRFIIYVDHGLNDKWKSPFELINKDLALFNALRNHLLAIHDFKGNQNIEITSDAKEMFDSWAKEIEFAIRAGILSKEEGTENTTLFARKVHHAKKIAALLAISRQVDSGTLANGVEIQLEDVNNAIECICFFEAKSIGYLRDLNKPAPLRSSSERLEFVIKNAGAEGINRTRLLTKSGMSAYQLQKELDVLKEDGIIFNSAIPTDGRPVVMYIHKEFYAK